MSIAASGFDGLLSETRPISDRFADRGRSLFLVGGIVRDTLLGRAVETLDIDLTTDASPDEIEAILRSLRPAAMWTQGKRFGTVGANIVGPDGLRAYEITTHRADEYDTDSRKPAVTFASDIDADLSRRDFTVNAIAVSTNDGTLIDPFGGLDDLGAHLLRTPIEAERSFRDDPLRMLRAARFIAAFDLKPTADVVAAIGLVRERLGIVSRERVHAELVKLLLLPAPGRGVGFLHDCGLLDDVLPPLGATGAPPWFDRIGELPVDKTVRLAALMLRPPSDTTRDPSTTATNGEAVAPRGREILRALRCSSAEIDDMFDLLTARTTLRLLLHATDLASPPVLRRFMRSTGRAATAAMVLTRWELAADPNEATLLAALDRFEVDLTALRSREDLDDLASPLDGDAIMAYLGVPAGRAVGDALAMLLEARLEYGPIDRVRALQLLDTWRSRSGSNSGG